MVSILLGVLRVEWRWCVLLLVRLVQWCSPYPTHPTAVLPSTAVVSRAVRCWVCGVWAACVCPYSFVWWGDPPIAPPRRGGGGGHSGWWGAVVWWGGIALKGGCCGVDPPVYRWCPPCRLSCGPIEWRVWYVL